MRWGTILGIIGLVIIVGNVGNTVWQDIQSGSVIVTRVCIANHYNISQGCTQADHTLSMPQAGQAYVVTNAAGAANGVSDYMVVQDNANGTTTDIATWSTDVSNGHHYVVELATLWGEKIQAGSYEVVTQRSNGPSLHYKLTIYQPIHPPHAATATPTATSGTPTPSTTTSGAATPTPN